MNEEAVAVVQTLGAQIAKLHDVVQGICVALGRQTVQEEVEPMEKSARVSEMLDFHIANLKNVQHIVEVIGMEVQDVLRRVVS